MDTTPLIGAILGGLAIIIIIWSLFPKRMLSIGDDLRDVEAGRSGSLRLATPFLRMVAPFVKDMFGNSYEKRKQEVDKRIVMADWEDAITAEEYMAGTPLGIAVGLGIGIIFVVLMLLKGFSPFFGILLGGLATLIFGMLPKTLLDGAINRRHKKVFRALPYTLDLLTVCVEAGLDFVGGLQKVSRDTSPGPLRSEISRMLQQMQLGKTRVEVLKQMKHRVNHSDLSSVVTALVQASELGAPLGPALRQQAETCRVKRAQRAETLANEAPVKMLVPLLLFIFPSIFIIILGPIALQIVFGR